MKMHSKLGISTACLVGAMTLFGPVQSATAQPCGYIEDGHIAYYNHCGPNEALVTITEYKNSERSLRLQCVQPGTTTLGVAAPFGGDGITWASSDGRGC